MFVKKNTIIKKQWIIFRLLMSENRIPVDGISDYKSNEVNISWNILWP